MRQSGGLRRNGNFLYLWGGRAFSEFGDFFGELAISWLVYARTGSATSLGVTWLFFLIPRSAVRLWGGVYVDRLDRRRVMIFTETSRALLFVFLAYAAYAGEAGLLLVYAVSACVGLLGAMFDLSSEALLPTIVDRDSLLSANSIFTATFQVDNILGPAVAGFAILLLGTVTPLLVDGLSFAVLALALLMIKIPPDPLREMVRGRWATEFREGWRFFRARRELVWLAVMTAGVNFSLGAFWYVFSLILAKDVLHSGSAGWGFLNAFSALGIFVASVYLGRSGISRRRLSVVSSLLAMGLSVVTLSFTTTLLEALFVIMAFGTAIPLISIVSTTYYQETVPGHLRGRVFGVRQFIDYVTVPAGIVFGILATEWVGVTSGILASGLLILVVGIACVFAKPLGVLDQTPIPTEAT